MWDRLKQSDLAEAKQQLRRRVDETLRRHAEEIRGLDNDVAEVEVLNRLVDAFSEKFGTAPAAPMAAAKGPEAAASGNAPDRPASRSRQAEPEQERRAGARTNFDAFTRAVSKSERGW
jgi:hypothetical protein